MMNLDEYLESISNGFDGVVYHIADSTGDAPLCGAALETTELSDRLDPCGCHVIKSKAIGFWHSKDLKKVNCTACKVLIEETSK